MANFMQVSVCLPELQYFKLVFLNIYNCTWKPGYLKSCHIFTYVCMYFCMYGIIYVCVILIFLPEDTISPANDTAEKMPAMEKVQEIFLLLYL